MRYDERDMDAERPDEPRPRAVTVRDLKAYGYSVAITIALISLGTSVLFGSPSLSLSQQTRLYDYVAPVIVLVVGVAAIAALLKNLVPVEKFEKLMVPVGSVVFLATFGYWLLAGPEFRTVTDIEAWYWLIASLWSTSFLAYSFKHALVFNISMATVRLGLILLSTWLKSPPDELDENMIRIVESSLHLAATLTLVAVLGYIKEQWVSVESEAVSLRTMAHIDGLTGVYNRRRTAEILAACLDPRYMACAVVMFDLDDFKRINDQFGHEAGDQVLRRVGTLARGYVRPTDRVGRWGGEEFLMVLPNTTLAEASRMAEASDVSWKPATRSMASRLRPASAWPSGGPAKRWNSSWAGPTRRCTRPKPTERTWSLRPTTARRNRI